MSDVCLQRDAEIITIDGTLVTVTTGRITVTAEGCKPVVIAGGDFDRLKAEVARHVSLDDILGRPTLGVNGDKIYMTIRPA